MGHIQLFSLRLSVLLKLVTLSYPSVHFWLSYVIDRENSDSLYNHTASPSTLNLQINPIEAQVINASNYPFNCFVFFLEHQ